MHLVCFFITTTQYSISVYHVGNYAYNFTNEPIQNAKCTHILTFLSQQPCAAVFE